MEFRCTECKDHLFDEIEIDTMLCMHCADSMYQREQNRREWDYFHPGEPCPPEERK